MAKVAACFERVSLGLEQAAEKCRAETGPEATVRHLTEATRACLGDPDAPEKPGTPKPGEAQFVCSGMFNTAAQARFMYDETDLRMQVLFANLAAATSVARGGPGQIIKPVATRPPWEAPAST